MLKEANDDTHASPQIIQEALNAMQLVAITSKNEEMFIKAKIDPLCNKIFKLLKIDMPLNINRKSELIPRFGLDQLPDDVQMALF